MAIKELTANRSPEIVEESERTSKGEEETTNIENPLKRKHDTRNPYRETVYEKRARERSH